MLAIVNAYKEKRNEITAQAENLAQHLLNGNILNTNVDNVDNSEQTLHTIAENLIKLADGKWGGFGQAPKFPQTFSIIYLLRHSFFTGNEVALNTAILSLDKMMMGGIYDHLSGGFCRYSTDARWQIPHFEKMLYDNALLIDVFTEAYQLTEKQEYAVVVEETISFIKNEMTSPEGGFYSAFDADSEGVEGKYYTWSKKEVDELLQERSAVFCVAYDISEDGNWEDTNILWLPETLETIGERSGINKDELIINLNQSKQILFEERKKRIRPGLDNKILLGWNALMVTSLCKAGSALGNEEYLKQAEENIAFIEQHLFDQENNLLHSWNRIVNTQPAFLDDYAALIQAYIFLHQSTGDTDYLLKAKKLADQAIELFSDEENKFFYFTSHRQTDVLLRKIEVYDGATPSGNSLMAGNLRMLSVFFDIPEWRTRAERMLSYIKKFAEKYPASFGVWGLNLQALMYGLKEIVLMQQDYHFLLKQILEEYIPLKILQVSARENNEWPLLKGKPIMINQTNIYICENYSCLKPAVSFEEFKNQLIKPFLTKKAAEQNISKL